MEKREAIAERERDVHECGPCLSSTKNEEQLQLQEIEVELSLLHFIFKDKERDETKGGQTFVHNHCP